MRLNINGEWRDLDVAGHETVLAVLRDRLGMTGTKLACGRGECGACTVLVRAGDAAPRAVYSCLTLASACDELEITTIEGVGHGELHPLQKAFIARDALQCGYCTPGQIMAACALLAENTAPSESDVRVALSGNLCRCGTHPKLVAAVLDAARELAHER